MLSGMCRPRAALFAGLVVVLAATGTACSAGGSTQSGSAGTGSTAGGGAPRTVVTSFYPVEYLAERIGGDLVTVTTVTKPGTEPHDVELTPKDLASITDADLVVYARGFQPALDDAVAKRQGPTTDLSPIADLPPDAASAGDGSAGSTGNDPHFWLDPQRYARAAAEVAAQLATIDPTHRAAYEANATTLAGELRTLDGEFTTGLRSCAAKDLVVNHAAFGYLAARYGFTQRAIVLDPEAEPSPAKLAEVAGFVRANKVSTIYAETLVARAFADTVARATGATVATLDPLEGITDTSAAQDYLGVMRANLHTLEVGQQCP